MMKIKFNMDFRGEYIRNLEDLRNNFSVEDILEAYDNGLLVKWLDARYYTNELKQVQAIETKNARGVLEELIRIFCPETEQEEIDENLTLYDYLEERRKYCEYITANGLDELDKLKREGDTLKKERDKNAELKTELEALRKKCDTLRQELDNNAKLKAELEALRKENDNLKHQIEPQKQSSTSQSSSSSLIEARIPAGYTVNWQVIRGRGKRYRIKGIGNSAYILIVKGADDHVICSIEDAAKKQIIFNGLSVRGCNAQYHNTLYFYYEEV